MLRLLITFFVVLLLALAGVWLAELDGLVTLALPAAGLEVDIPLLTAIIVLLLVLLAGLILWKLLSGILGAPARARRALRMRRRRKAREAIVTGLIAVEAGETNRAMALAARADRLSGDKSLVKLLEARAALSNGDKRRAAQIYKDMLGNPRTRLLGMRGLYDLALEEERFAEAEELAFQAREISTDAGWAIEGVLTAQVQAENWRDALKTVQAMADGRFIERARARRLRAVLLTAIANDRNETVDEAYAAAKEAHSLAPDLPPAALRAAELASARGDERKARKMLEAAFAAMPHPDLAEAYLALGHADSVAERAKKARKLAEKAPEHRESRLMVAGAALDAGQYAEARAQLTAVLQSAPTVRAFQLMAELEDREAGDVGRAREWLSRALHAPRDAQWMADGIASENWGPVGPISGKLDAYEWKVPVTSLTAAPALSAEDFAAISRVQESPRPPVVVEAPAPDLGTERKPAPGEKAAPGAVMEKADTEKPVETSAAPAEIIVPPKPARPAPEAQDDASEDVPAFARQPDDPGLDETEEDEETSPVPDVPRRM